MTASNGFDRQVIVLAEAALRLSTPADDRVRVLGHRGAPAAGIPENSVAAVAEALQQGADGVEIDVWLAADGTLVCAHEVDSSAVRGSLATLTEVLAAVQGSAGCRVVVEAKPVEGAALAQATADALAEVLRADAGHADIVISSFDPALLGMIRRSCADLPVRTALLGSKADPATAVVQRACEDGHDEVHLPLVAVRRTPDAAGTARRLGLSVSLWTVNEPADLRWAAELGVDAVITDDVLTARSESDRAATAAPVAA
jgi:glycerophosphoryl diester phosphodiesterase